MSKSPGNDGPSSRDARPPATLAAKDAANLMTGAGGLKAQQGTPPPDAPAVFDDAKGSTSKGVRSARAAAAKPMIISGYRVMREIARGGQAVVYEVVQLSTGRRVAMKILSGGVFVGPRVRTRFEREVQILASLKHPGIVQIIDRGNTADGSLFLVMNLISGKPLDKFLESYYAAHSDGPPPEDPSELLKLFLKIAEAVNAAHVRGVIHRDLKPSNIRVDDRGEPCVLDFGLARPALSANSDQEGLPVTVVGTFLGSLPWASPEQAEGDLENLDVRTDVYSLGVILYQMLTGRFPYAVAGTMRDVLNNIMTAAPTPPSKIGAGAAGKQPGKQRGGKLKPVGSVHPAVEAIVMKALAKAREDRYQSAGDLARDVRNYLAGKTTEATADQQNRPASARFALITTAFLCICLTAALIWSLRRGTARVAPDSSISAQAATQKSAAPDTMVSQVQPGPGQPILTPTIAAQPAQPVPIVSAGPTDSKFPDPPGRQSFINSMGMKFFRIEAGEFIMGSASAPKDGKYTAKAHHVTLTKPYWMGETEVTVGQWKQFVNNTNYVTAREGDPTSANWRNPGWINTDDLPATNLNWEGAVAFCQWMGTKDGRSYRLPTEAEWEYACRAGTHGNLYTDGPLTPEDAPFGTKSPPPGSSLRPNPWGLRGLFGSLVEWCSDWVDPYPDGPVVDPVGPDHQTGQSDRGEGKVYRGGWFNGNPWTTACWSRGWCAPALGMGFRVVMEDKPTPAAPAALAPQQPLIDRHADVAVINCGNNDPNVDIHTTRTGDLVVEQGQQIGSVSAAQLSQCIIRTGDVANSINLATTGTLDVQVACGRGDKTIRVGAKGTFVGCTGQISINGGDGSCRVELDDSDNTSDTSYTIDGDKIACSRAGPVQLSNVSEVTVLGGRAWATGSTENRKFTVLSTSPGTHYILNTGEGRARVYVGSETSTNGDLRTLRGPLSIDTQGDEMSVNLVDTLRRGPAVYHFDGADFQRDDLPPIRVTGTPSMSIQLCVSDDPCTVDVEGTAGYHAVNVFGSPDGNCQMNVCKHAGSLKGISSDSGVMFSVGGNVELFDQLPDENQEYVLKSNYLTRSLAKPYHFSCCINYPSHSTITLHASATGTLKGTGPPKNIPRVKVIAPPEFKIEHAEGFPEASRSLPSN